MRIENDISEYIHSKNINDLKGSLDEIADKQMIPKYMCIGNYIVWSFSQKEKEAQEVNQLIITLKETNAISVADIEIGYVCLILNKYL